MGKVAGVDYAQRQREQALEKKMVAKKEATTYAYGVGMAYGIKSALEDMAKMAAIEKVERRAREAGLTKATSPSESLDASMTRFMKVSHDILVQRTEEYLHGRATYRFVNPATGDYYDCEYDHRFDDDLRSAQDARLKMMEAALDYLKRAQEAREEKPLKKPSPYTDDAGRYTDIEGRTFVPVTKGAEEKPKHREGHFPTHWVEEAMDRADASEKCITITMERKGVMVVATEGDDKYSSHVITWEMMEKAHVNPLPLAIEDCEKKLALLGKMKAKLKK